MNLKRKSWYLLILILAIALTTGFFILKKEVHYHAGFQVYVDDEIQDFSDLAYMQIEPCGDEEHKKESEEHEQIEKAHLHDGVDDVVHVHRENAVWGDLFTNINFPISDELKAYVNGATVENILNYPITSYDSVVMFQGEINELDEKLKDAVTREHIIEVEGKSETC